ITDKVAFNGNAYGDAHRPTEAPQWNLRTPGARGQNEVPRCDPPAGKRDHNLALFGVDAFHRGVLENPDAAAITDDSQGTKQVDGSHTGVIRVIEGAEQAF